jgi:hypothetical protein
MKHNIILKFVLLAALASLGLATRAVAEDAVPSGPVVSQVGLLGETYAGLSYSYLNLDSSPAHADGFGFQYNQPLNSGLDGILTYDWTQSGLVAGSRLNQQTIGGALRAFSQSRRWGKPYVEAGVSYAWTKFAGMKDNSLIWGIAIGAEIQLATAFAVTPFIQYQNAPDLASGSVWNLGVKANYWIDRQWALTGAIIRDDDHNTTFTLGTNFRF